MKSEAPGHLMKTPTALAQGSPELGQVGVPAASKEPKPQETPSKSHQL